jgi:cytochrome o ubiquinol oxidase subunit 2
MNKNFIGLGIAALIMIGIAVFGFTHSAEMVVLNPQGPVGLEERWVIDVTILLSAVVVIPVFFMLFMFAWQFRANNPKAHRTHDPNWDHDSIWAELVWWCVPTVIVIFLSFVAWKTTYELDPFKPLQGGAPPLMIQVVALDWKWLFIYPQQGIATVNMVEFPANTPVHFYITSDAPMNSFWIPSLGGQIMAMPGMTTQLNLLANNEGSYTGLSSNISGDGFAGMGFTVHSVSPTAFSAWVQSVKQSGTPLTTDSYDALAKPSEYNPVSVYSSIDSGLYTANVMKYMIPAMAPATNAPEPSMTSMQGMQMATTSP